MLRVIQGQTGQNDEGRGPLDSSPCHSVFCLYGVFIKYCVFHENIDNFLNSARSAGDRSAQLAVRQRNTDTDLPHTDQYILTHGTRVQNIF